LRTGGGAQINSSITVQTVNLNSIRVKIAGRFNIALIDTGCGTSIISHKCLRKNHLEMRNLNRGQNYMLFAANGTKSEF